MTSKLNNNIICKKIKTIKKIKLTTLSKNELEKRRMNLFKGGVEPGYCDGELRCNCGLNDPADVSSTGNWRKA